MTYIRSLYRASLAVAVAFAAACVDSAPATAPNPFDATEDPLALTFDALSAQSDSSGDRARSEGFAYAAIAVRRGIVPSRIDISNKGTVEAFDGFVSALEWDPTIADQLRAPNHRSMIAWRRTNDGLTRILSLTTPIDSAPILNPLSLSATSPYAAFFAAATAQYQETTAPVTVTGQSNATKPDLFWGGVAGYVKIQEVSRGGQCFAATNKQLQGVTCQVARYSVQFDVGLHLLAKRPITVDMASALRNMSAREQTVNGVRLGLSCARVESTSGCG
jgi:hypothetical protein